MLFDRHRYGSHASAVRAIVLASGSLVAATPAFATNWYVDGAYGRSYHSGRSYSDAFQSFSQAMGNAQGGDTIYLNPTTTYSTLFVTKSGWSGKPITISGTGGSSNPTKISGFYSNFGVWVNASYVTMQYLNVTAPGAYSGIHVNQGKHHVTITHNVVSGSGGDGIDTIGTDYLTVSYNVVYNNATNTSQAFGSGISVKGSSAVDGNTGIKQQIIGNIVFANTNKPRCGSCSNSDGSGIIIDNNRRTDIDNVWYRGGFLIANNIVTGNGGRGIHLYRSDNITINGNTLFNNNQDSHEGYWRPGEVSGDTVSAVSVYNNILYSDGRQINGWTGSHVPISFQNCHGGFGGISIGNNLGYRPQNDSGSFLFTQNMSVSVNRWSSYWGNPKFASANTWATSANFRVHYGSPALYNGGSNVLSTDIAGSRRYSPSTIGAYQNATN